MFYLQAAATKFQSIFMLGRNNYTKEAIRLLFVEKPFIIFEIDKNTHKMLILAASLIPDLTLKITY